MAEELEPLWRTALLLRVPEAFGYFISKNHEFLMEPPPSLSEGIMVCCIFCPSWLCCPEEAEKAREVRPQTAEYVHTAECVSCASFFCVLAKT